MAKVRNFAIRGRTALLGIGATGNIANDAGRAKFGSELSFVETPVNHLIAVRSDGDAVL